MNSRDKSWHQCDTCTAATLTQFLLASCRVLALEMSTLLASVSNRLCPSLCVWAVLKYGGKKWSILWYFIETSISHVIRVRVQQERIS